MNIRRLVRENIRNLVPYSSARKEFTGRDGIFLDANENSFGSPLARDFSRYPDPLQLAIKERLGNPDEIFIGNGSDEAIDLLFRIFCEPRADNVIICPPTYGMYEVSAAINDVEVRRANLTKDFSLDPEAIFAATDERTKLLFVCSPNNPTGNAFPREEIIALARAFSGIVVVDEAYVHFSAVASIRDEISNLPNVVVLQTFSKAWGLAGLRVGLAFANREIIALFNNVKPPYNVSQIAQEAILEAIANKDEFAGNLRGILSERARLLEGLSKLTIVKRIYPTDANFVLVRTDDADAIYRYLLTNAIVVRNRSRVELCEGCLRITIGTPDENDALLAALADRQLTMNNAPIQL